MIRRLVEMAGQSLLVSLLGGIALLLWSTRLVRAKDDVRAVERAATESHLRRLRERAVASMETSSLLLDILRDLQRIIAHLTDVAYPILEADPRSIGRTQGLAAGTEPAGASTRHILGLCSP
jgi:Na+/phosphate symporter